jgi:hypothetical protein
LIVKTEPVKRLNVSEGRETLWQSPQLPPAAPAGPYSWGLMKGNLVVTAANGDIVYSALPLPLKVS